MNSSVDDADDYSTGDECYAGFDPDEIYANKDASDGSEVEVEAEVELEVADVDNNDAHDDTTDSRNLQAIGLSNEKNGVMNAIDTAVVKGKEVEEISNSTSQDTMFEEMLLTDDTSFSLQPFTQCENDGDKYHQKTGSSNVGINGSEMSSSRRSDISLNGRGIGVGRVLAPKKYEEYITQEMDTQETYVHTNDNRTAEETYGHTNDNRTAEETYGHADDDRTAEETYVHADDNRTREVKGEVQVKDEHDDDDDEDEEEDNVATQPSEYTQMDVNSYEYEKKKRKQERSDKRERKRIRAELREIRAKLKSRKAPTPFTQQ